MPVDIPKTDDRYASEKAGLDVVKESKPIEGAIQPISFHQHNGTDGSPKIVSKNIIDKDEGGKYLTTIAPATFYTTSATYVDVTSATKTFTKGEATRRYLLLFSAGLLNDTIEKVCSIIFDIDGTGAGEFTYGRGDDVAFTGVTIPMSLHFITDELASGSHTIKVQVKTTGGTFFLYNMKFSIIELII